MRLCSETIGRDTMKKLIIGVALSAFIVATPSLAATDGNLSTNHSTGKLTVKAHIPNMVRISGLDDLTIAVTPAALSNPYFHRQDAQSDFCVYSNDGAEGGYNISVDGDAGTDSPYQLTGANGTLGYSVWISDDPNNPFTGAGVAGAGYTYPGSQKTNYQTTRDGNARPTTIDCSDVGNSDASLHIGIDNTKILAAQSGTYKGVLRVTVSPL